MKCVMVWPLSLHYSHSLAKPLFLHLLEMMVGRISIPEVFGEDARVQFLILGRFIPTYLAIA